VAQRVSAGAGGGGGAGGGRGLELVILFQRGKVEGCSGWLQWVVGHRIRPDYGRESLGGWDRVRKPIQVLGHQRGLREMPGSGTKSWVSWGQLGAWPWGH
jgi:hypothetical protein